MLRGIPGESPSGNHAHANANSNSNSNSNANAEEEELEHEILMEILEEGRGEREEQGEREEWKEHVGWHRKENVGVLRHGSKTATHVHRSGEHAADSVVAGAASASAGAGAAGAGASASADAASASVSAAARKPLRGSRHGVADTDDGRLPSAFVAPTAEPGWESELEFHFSLLSVVVRVLLGIVLALAASRCMARGVSRRFVLSADGMGNRRRSSKERTL